MINQIEDNTFTSTQRSNEPTTFVATFILKLYNILSDPKNAFIISWSQDGRSFIIKCTHLFTERILPHYFRHKNYQSFIRQLNMYNFTKAKMFPQQKYWNKYFTRQEQKLRWIKRRPEKKKKKENIQNFKQKQQQETIQKMVKSSPKLDKALENIFQQNINIPTKKVCFNQSQNQDQHNSSLIQATSKWLTKNQSKHFCSFKSFTSIKFLQNGEGFQIKEENVNEQYIPKSIANIMLCSQITKNIQPY